MVVGWPSAGAGGAGGLSPLAIHSLHTFPNMVTIYVYVIHIRTFGALIWIAFSLFGLISLFGIYFNIYISLFGKLHTLSP